MWKTNLLPTFIEESLWKKTYQKKNICQGLELSCFLDFLFSHLDPVYIPPVSEKKKKNIKKQNQQYVLVFDAKCFSLPGYTV